MREMEHFLRDSAAQNVTLGITSATRQLIAYSFSTPNINNPKINGNIVYIWQSGNAIPFTGPNDAFKSNPVGSASPTGSNVFDGLDLNANSYIIGYAVGPESKPYRYANVVASAFIPAIGGAGSPPVSTTVAIAEIGTTSLVAAYNFLAGFSPQEAGSWAGLWIGDSISVSTAPIAWSPINDSNNAGQVGFNNISIGRGTRYTVGLFASGYSTDVTKLKFSPLACTVTFG